MRGKLKGDWGEGVFNGSFAGLGNRIGDMGYRACDINAVDMDRVEEKCRSDTFNGGIVRGVVFRYGGTTRIVC